jgi:lysophospholipase L1-like esterase
MKLSNAMALAGLIAATGVGGTAVARDRAEQHEKVLVLGDSVAFGYINSAGYEYVNPENFVGFPRYLDDILDLDPVDAACPGETTGSFLSATLPDFGCRNFRKNFPLHVAYRSTQLEFAKRYLMSHHDVRLVTITLGANDGFLLEISCNDEPACIVAGLPAVATNLATILSDLRASGYGGDIVVTNYYSTDYSDSVAGQEITGLTAALNAAIAAPTAAYGAIVADVFTAFQKAVAPFGNSPCQAGLLNVSNPIPTTLPYTCDVHPTQSGHRLIAETISHALRTEDRY